MKKTYLTNDDVYRRANEIALQISNVKKSAAVTDQKELDSIINIYGVPRGGVPVVYIVHGLLNYNGYITTIVESPDNAHFIVDDIIDSGVTRERYFSINNKPFYALVDKQNKDKDIGWVVFPWEQEEDGNEDSAEDIIIRTLQYIGEDINRDGLKDTPKRVIKSYDELYSGYNQDPATVFTTFEKGKYNQIILLKDIEFYSTCEHHMLPFFGKAHIAYIPGEKVLGISKLSRLLEIYSRRLQIQERIGEQVTDSLMEYLKPQAAACIIQAQHLCMQARGIHKQHSVMVTSSLRGAFFEKAPAREELMRLIG